MIAIAASILLAGVFFGGGLFETGYMMTGLVLGGACTWLLGILFAAQESVIRDLSQPTDVETYNDDIDWLDW